MKNMLSSNRHRYMARVGIFSIMVALIAGTVGCVGADGSNGGDCYTLIVDFTAGGTVAVNDLPIPGKAILTYGAGMVVTVSATASTGYRFVEWTGNASTIDDVSVASTTITMNGDYSVTANFAMIPSAEYDLTVSSTSGGSVTTPTEGTSTYDEGMMVSLLATPDTGYQFVSWSGDVGTIANINAASTTIDMNGKYHITANFERKYTPMVAVGAFHTVGLKGDGTVVAVGYCEHGQCNVSSWMDVIQVAAGEWYTVGLKDDGTVVAAGDNAYGQCDVSSWTDIIQVAAGERHTVGLKDDGTVVAVGDNAYGQCNVTSWTDIIQVAAGWHTVGLKNDGTVVVVGRDFSEPRDVGSWTNVIEVDADFWHTVGVKSNGTAVAVGGNTYGQCDVGGWDLS